MRKLLAAALLALMAGTANAVDGVFGDIFPYENKHSSFTVEIDAAELDRFSIQVVYSTPSVSDVQFIQDDVSLGNNSISEPSHGLATGQPVLLATASLTAPNPLTSGTTYFAIRLSDNLIQLATTYAQAVSGDEIDILTAPALALTIRPLALGLGTAGYFWYGSNDGTNWTQVPSVGLTVAQSTQTLTVMGAFNGGRLHDWGEFAYRFLRFDFRGPAQGVIKLRAYLNGKKRE